MGGEDSEGTATLRLETSTSLSDDCAGFPADATPEGNVVLVTTAGSAEECIEAWRRDVGDLPHKLGVISVGELSRSASDTSSLPPTTPAIVGLDDPSDLTELGITLNRFLYSWVDPGRPTYLQFDSLSGLLQYVDPSTLRPFLQVLVGRVRETGTTGEFLLDPAAHDADTVEQLRSLFDDVVDPSGTSPDGAGGVVGTTAPASRGERGRFRSAVAAASAPILLTDFEGTVSYANPAACDLFDREDPTGLPLEDLFGEGTEDLLETVWWGEDWRGELTPERSDGPLVATAASLSEAAESDVSEGAVVVFTDVSDSRQQIADLRRQNEHLEEFASSVAHDLRNQLQLAKGNLSLLLENAEKVEGPLDRMSDVIEDALSVAREAEADTELYDLGSVAREAWQGIEAPDGELVVDHSASIVADRGKLLRLFRNLFRNAVEHGAPDVTVRVGTLDGGFYVADDGPGIPPEQWDQIFDHGFSTRDGNTGYGLAIVERICELHDWSIAVGRSSSGGARFEITGIDFGD